jgi:hypothetical protein
LGTYDLFRTIAKSNLSSKERTIEQMQYDILADFYDSPSYQSVTINNVSRDVQILDENAITKNPNKKRVLCKPDEDINIGDDILWNSQHWLCTNIDSDKEIYAKGIIERCNNTLSFYKNGILKEIPCIITAVGNSLGLSTDETRYISDLGDFIIVRVPNNVTSQLININQVFKIGRWNFRVENISDIIEVGLLVMKMSWVANEAETHIYTLEILNGTSFDLQEGSSVQLQVNIFDNGILMNPKPTLNYSSNNITKATISSSGLITGVDAGNCTITVSMSNNNAILDTININVVELPVDNITYEIVGESIIKYNQVKSYDAIRYVNGVVDNTAIFTFSIINGSTPTTAYQLNTVDSNTCTIKCLQYPYNITLRATNNDGGQYVEKLIQLKSIM